MPREKPTVLVVERASDATRGLISFLHDNGFEAVWARDGESALHVIEDTDVDFLVSALEAPRIDGLTILRRARTRHPAICAVVVTEPAALERAVEAMREGAYDVQTRPVNREKLLAVLERGQKDQRLAARVEEMQGRLDRRFGLELLVGRSRAITRVQEQVAHVASTRTAVLIEGESGTGKGLVARSIHQNSARKRERFVWINCAAVAAGVIEGEMFGVHRDQTDGGPRRGRFELAEGGTLFIDGIGALPAPVQVKLLRAIRERAYERQGGGDTLRADVRLLAATNRNLAAEVRAGRFRADLYERLSVARIVMPPLRERREDIPVLVDSFIREFNRRLGRRVKGITRGALERLVAHGWPGNVRELRATVEGVVVSAEERRPIQLSDLPAALRGPIGRSGALEVSVGMTVEESERVLIAATLRHTKNDKRRAAEMLGIGLRTLYRKIKAYGLG